MEEEVLAPAGGGTRTLTVVGMEGLSGVLFIGEEEAEGVVLHGVSLASAAEMVTC